MGKHTPELCELGLVHADDIVMCLRNARKLILQVLDGTICVRKQHSDVQT